MTDNTTEISVKETNPHGYGFTATLSIDPSLPSKVSFDIAWQHTLEDMVEDLEEVGVLMTANTARLLADHLRAFAKMADDLYDTETANV